MKHFFLSLLLLCSINTFAQQATQPQPGKPIKIPTHYSGDRFYALPVTQNNVTLVLFTDSAGSIFLNTDLVQKLGLATEMVKNENGRDLTLASLPSFKPNASIPVPLGSSYDGRLFVFPPRQTPAPFVSEPRDGMLGQQWFAGRVWTFDYPGKALLWRAPNDLPCCVERSAKRQQAEGTSDQLLFSTMRGSGWPRLNPQGIILVLSPGHPLPRMVLNNLVTCSELPEACRTFVERFQGVVRNRT